MMRNQPQPDGKLSAMDRLSVRLLLLFVVVFLLGFFGLFAYGISRSYLEKRVAEQNVVQNPPTVVVDPKLKDELSQVLASTSTDEAPADLHDPFNDRTGLVGLSEASRTGAATTASLSTSGTTTTGTGGTGTPTANSNGTASAPAEPQLTASEATKQRYAVWLDRAVMGDVPLDPRIFAIDDLMPVGLVDGGNGAQEVMFYSEAVGKTVSFPVGTMFYDGWLAQLRADGVVFRTDGEHQSYKLRSWVRSLKAAGS